MFKDGESVYIVSNKITKSQWICGNLTNYDHHDWQLSVGTYFKNVNMAK